MTGSTTTVGLSLEYWCPGPRGAVRIRPITSHATATCSGCEKCPVTTASAHPKSPLASMPSTIFAITSASTAVPPGGPQPGCRPNRHVGTCTGSTFIGPSTNGAIPPPTREPATNDEMTSTRGIYVSRLRALGHFNQACGALQLDLDRRLRHHTPDRISETGILRTHMTAIRPR